MMSNENLPVLELLPELKEIFERSNTVILQAPPGAGKSTALPLRLLEMPWLRDKKIIMLEPRRIAARSVATRMASLLGEPVGQTIGYRVRFEHKISPQTRLEVVTEGILTRMLQQDNSLEGIGLVIFDEFHERSLHADLALALCREIQLVLRDDLRILVMSATLDSAKLSALLGGAPILTSQGRQHPIQFHYASHESKEPVHGKVAKYILAALAQEEGDILAFLPGAGEIQRVTELLERESLQVSVFPLYGDLPFDKQQEAILPHPRGLRKVVLATSIAETSLTIEGIKIVIDCGLARSPRFDPKTGLTRLETLAVTKDAADQRAGRAGRLGPGICFRLWTWQQHQQLKEQRTPEIAEADLAPMLLELAQWGTNDIMAIAWLSPPPSGAVSQATDLLQRLDALQNGRITAKGAAMLQLPTHPRIAHLLLEGKVQGLPALAGDIAAILEERDPLPKDNGANLCARVEALRKWRKKEYVQAERGVLERIERVAALWRKNFKVMEDNSLFLMEDAGKLIAAAYPERIARQKDKDLKRFRLANGRIVALEDHDPLVREKWLAIAHLDAGKNEGKIYMAAPLNIKDLDHLMVFQEVIAWDAEKGMLLARRERRLEDIIVDSLPLDNIPEEKRIEVLCGAVRMEGMKLFNWTEALTDWQSRILCLRQWRPEMPWPDVSEEHLTATVKHWLPAYLLQVKKREDFYKLDLKEILSAALPWEMQQQLDRLAPDYLKVPSGSMIRLQYHPDGTPPILAVRLQEVFGLTDTPIVNEGRNKVMLHLLSPGYKPVQVTQDLKSFWMTTYTAVRKELRVRYSKHHWPEDPWTAEAVRGAKKGQ